MKRNAISIITVVVFWFFCIGSLGILIDEYYASKTYWEEELKEARQHNTSPRSTFIQSIKQGVFDSEGAWIHTEESYIPNNTLIRKVRSTFKNGKLDGERIYYDNEGDVIFSETYKNGVLVNKNVALNDTVQLLHVDQQELTTTYKILMKDRPWFITSMVIYGCSHAGLNSFFVSLEREIKKRNPKSEDDFFEAYSETLEALFSQGQLSAIDNAYGFIRAMELIEGSKKLGLRMAILDRYRGARQATYSILVAKYPSFLSLLQEKGAPATQTQQFTNELDRLMDAEGPIDPNNPIFPFIIDERIRSAQGKLVVENYPEVSMALFEITINIIRQTDPMYMASRKAFRGGFTPEIFQLLFN